MSVRQAGRKSFIRGLAVVLVGAAIVVAPTASAHADEVRDSQWMIDFLNLEEAWKITDGSGVTVGIVDTGVDATHPDLEGSVLPGAATVDDADEGDDGRTATDGHGTAMASLIAGHGHGSGGNDGIVGVAPGAQILPVHGLANALSGEDAVVPEAVRWLADNGADVISLSLGGTDDDELEEAVRYAAVEKGIPVVASAGNSGGVVEYPAAYGEAIAVSAVDSSGETWEHSSRGPEVSVAAPGAEMPSAGLNHEYRTASGTSDSAAVVAGVLALLRAQFPDETRMELYWRLTELAKDAGEDGPDDEYGFGIVDPVAALTGDPGPLPEDLKDPEPTGSPEPSGSDSEEAATDATGDSGASPLIGFGLIGAAIVVLAAGVIFFILRRKKTAPAVTGPAPGYSQYGPPPGPLNPSGYRSPPSPPDPIQRPPTPELPTGV